MADLASQTSPSSPSTRTSTRRPRRTDSPVAAFSQGTEHKLDLASKLAHQLSLIAESEHRGALASSAGSGARGEILTLPVIDVRQQTLEGFELPDEMVRAVIASTPEDRGNGEPPHPAPPSEGRPTTRPSSATRRKSAAERKAVPGRKAVTEPRASATRHDVVPQAAAGVAQAARSSDTAVPTILPSAVQEASPVATATMPVANLAATASNVALRELLEIERAKSALFAQGFDALREALTDGQREARVRERRLMRVVTATLVALGLMVLVTAATLVHALNAERVQAENNARIEHVAQQSRDALLALIAATAQQSSAKNAAIATSGGAPANATRNGVDGSASAGGAGNASPGDNAAHSGRRARARAHSSNG